MMGDVASERPIITFTSDFGAREYYVGAVKGVLLTHCPQATIVDISHQVSSHDLLEAAFTLASAFSAFPAGTTHLVVVDPGVGSDRRGLIVSCHNHRFVAPDNGLLSLILEHRPADHIVSIESEHYFRHPVSETFHGRDIFAPVAGELARGIDMSKFGPPIRDPVRLSLPPVKRHGTNAVDGVVLHIDKFGNIITSLSPEGVAALFSNPVKPMIFRLGDHQVTTICRFYSEGSRADCMALVGSSGYYEIAAWKKSAAQALGVRRGLTVRLEVSPGG